MSAAHCPAILIAVPAFGQGKTTLACALARLYARQGRQERRVRVSKYGPDFLNPHWLWLLWGQSKRVTFTPGSHPIRLRLRDCF